MNSYHIERFRKIFLGITIGLATIFVIYISYVLLTNTRIEDNQKIKVDNPGNLPKVETGTDLDITTWNIGFGAYLQDYTFFMDGGDESRARSKEILTETMEEICKTLKGYKSDFYLVQEVDFNSTRTHKVDERKMIRETFPKKSYVFAENYHSPYLQYPILNPHGANNSGLVTMADYKMDSSLRRQLPIQEGLGSIVDLDRCLNVTRLSTDNGKELVLINTHLTAYTNDPTVATRQLELVYEIIEKEYRAGNYVICGGDMNKDLTGHCEEVFGIKVANEEDLWCKPFPIDTLPACTSLVVALDEKKPIGTCRDSGVPYERGKTFETFLDGFIITDNVEVVASGVHDEEYLYSDHNPVTMTFRLAQ